MESLALNTLQQNSSIEYSGGVVILKEELNKTLKEETIEILNEDKTQVDISRSQYMDFGGNQDQVTNQEELNP